MNSGPYLNDEDRPEYERLLDDVLRRAHERPGLRAGGERLSTEQLRTLALGATHRIAAAAATEYDRYVQVREGRRGSAVLSASSGTVFSPPRSDSDFSGSGSRTSVRRASAALGLRFAAAVLGAGRPGDRRISDGVAPRRWAGMSFGRRLLAALLGLRVIPEAPRAAQTHRRRGSERHRAPHTSVRRPADHTPDRSRPISHEFLDEEPTGAGALAVAAVLAPVFAGTATVIFLLVGYLLALLSPQPGFAHTLVTVGWWFAAATAAAVLAAAVGLVVTALRSGPTSPAAEEQAEDLGDDVSSAREAWQRALVERGILPFLREAEADPSAEPPQHDAHRSPGRIPTIGYGRVGLSNPDFSGPTVGPGPASYSRPDLATPDFGGSESPSE
ncbi:hypothetical protein ACWGI1_26415 [Streptomyces sp. NPDC054835]|uniref:hypothetical protein n=1 Tax=Streptomyces sp. NBC_01268 TaxID=2903806 RepID=UPI003FCEBC3A